MAFPTGTDGLIYNDYIYDGTKGAWKKYVEKFIRVTNPSVPDFNATLANSTSTIFDATSKVPSNTVAVELRVWYSSSTNNIYNLIEYGPGDEAILGNGKHAAFGDSNVVVNGYTHVTIKVYLDSTKKFKILGGNASATGTITINASITGYYTI